MNQLGYLPQILKVLAVVACIAFIAVNFMFITAPVTKYFYQKIFTFAFRAIY
jgi:flagellar biosynthesis/type III secretory pathway M-ring protein FliF/YscJ